MNNPLFKRLLAVWPFLILGTLAVVFALMLTFSRKAPVIVSLEPSMAAPGQTVVLTGDYFGRTEREGSLSLAGEIPPPSLIQTWTDQKIVFTVPEDATSGLVTVSNSQGTSTGVLFTNTETIPTVLQSVAEPGKPLVLAVMPGEPNAGQTTTLTGRGFGLGDEKVEVRLDAGRGAVVEVTPSDSLTWTDRSVTFRWPAGPGSGTKLTVVTAQGSSAPVGLDAVGPVAFGEPRTMTVEFRARLSLSGSEATLWGSVPLPSSVTVWSLVSSEPASLVTPGFVAFRWPQGTSGDLQASYRLTLTSYAKIWKGWSAGAVPTAQDAPAGDDAPTVLWRPAASALKVLTASWGQSTPDPWLRIQRIQTGLAAAFHLTVSQRPSLDLSGAPAALLASGRLDSTEAATLAAYLAIQSGIPVRLVSGLWWGEDDRVLPRSWAEVWITGAGWIPWDVVDGNPGSLDNRHFAFQASGSFPARLLPRSRTFGPPPPGTLGGFSGEFLGSEVPSAVRWELKRIDK